MRTVRTEDRKEVMPRRRQKSFLPPPLFTNVNFLIINYLRVLFIVFSFAYKDTKNERVKQITSSFSCGGAEYLGLTSQVLAKDFKAAENPNYNPDLSDGRAPPTATPPLWGQCGMKASFNLQFSSFAPRHRLSELISALGLASFATAEPLGSLRSASSDAFTHIADFFYS